MPHTSPHICDKALRGGGVDEGRTDPSGTFGLPDDLQYLCRRRRKICCGGSAEDKWVDVREKGPARGAGRGDDSIKALESTTRQRKNRIKWPFLRHIYFKNSIRVNDPSTKIRPSKEYTSSFLLQRLDQPV